MATRISIDTTTPPSTTGSNEPDLTDGSSAGSSPTLEQNHLTTYFPGPAGAAAKMADSPTAPVVPQRVPSHSKREHERLARKRSLRGSALTGMTAQSPIVAVPPPPAMMFSDERSSIAMMGGTDFVPMHPLPKLQTPFTHPSPTSHLAPRREHTPLGPFTPELERLTEALEEQFKVGPKADEDDDLYMRNRGLVKFDVSVYCADIGFCNPFTPIDTGMHSYNMSAWI